MTSRPKPPIRRSKPRPPVRMSLPAPPASVSCAVSEQLVVAAEAEQAIPVAAAGEDVGGRRAEDRLGRDVGDVDGEHLVEGEPLGVRHAHGDLVRSAGLEVEQAAIGDDEVGARDRKAAAGAVEKRECRRVADRGIRVGRRERADDGRIGRILGDRGGRKGDVCRRRVDDLNGREGAVRERESEPLCRCRRASRPVYR